MPTDTIGEFELIRKIRDRARPHPLVALGIGDDAAVLSLSNPGRSLVVTKDMLLDGRHFKLADCGPEAVGHKSLAVNLSDLAAMAAQPVAAFVAVALPRASASSIAQGLMDGMAPLVDQFGIALAGGDTNAWDGPLVVSVTLIGETVPPGPILRSGAKTGDEILVTGPLGGSILGRHLRPEPRVNEAMAMLAMTELHALIDLSDGLASDLGHILESSGGLGATLIEDALPIHPDARLLALQTGKAPLEHALGDGEDFELCVVVPPASANRLLQQPLPGIRLYHVGTIESQPGLRLQSPDGRIRIIDVRGFDHLLSTEGLTSAG